jgi:hypothetical protein
MRWNLIERQWNWMDDGVLTYALCAMRAVWVWLLLHLAARAFTPTRGDWIALPTVFGLLALSTLLSQYGIFRMKSDAGAALLVSFGGLVAVGLALYFGIGVDRAPLWDERWLRAMPDDVATSFVVLSVAVWLWRWGILTGRELVLYDVFSFNFTIGVFAFVIALAVAFGTNLVSLYELVLPLLLFFAIGLGTLALSSLQDARRFEGARTGQQIALNRFWLGTVGAIIGALLLGGLLLTQLFAPEYLAGVLSILAIGRDWIARLLFLILVIVAFIIFAILEFFARFLPPLNVSSNVQNIQTPPSFAEQFKDLEQRATASPSPEVYLVLQTIAGILIAGAIILIFALAFRRFRYLDKEEIEETRETIFSFDLMKEQLAQLFRRKGDEDTATAPFVSIVGDDPRAQIRRTYQTLLAWATERGVPRAPGMTPDEYATRLSGALQLHSEPIALITAAYVLTRYSTNEVSTNQAAQVARAWKQIVQVDGTT